MKHNREIPMRNCVFRISILAVLLVDCIAPPRTPGADTLDIPTDLRTRAAWQQRRRTAASLQGRYGAA